MSIDFGTSSSAVAIIRNRQPELASPIDSDAAGSRIFPTVVYVDLNRNIVACHDAERMKDFDCSRFLREFKLDIQNDIITDLGVTYTQLVKAVLKTLKVAAEKARGEAIENIVLTVPATYNENDVKQLVMLEAASEAGFKKIEIIKEAQAAAIYYDYIEQKPTGYSLINDLGGGTFDAAIIKHKKDDYQLIRNSSGLAIGGKFFTEKITENYVIQSETEVDYSNSALLDEILTKCERIKRHLSNNESGVFPISEGKSITFSRAEFEDLISTDIDKTLQACNSLVEEAELQWKDINRVLLIGGSCSIPLVQSKVKKYLISRDAADTNVVWKRTESDQAIDPQFAVSLGAAVYAIKQFMAPQAPPILPGVLKNIKTGEIYRLREGINVFGRGDVEFSFPTDAKMSRTHFTVDVIRNEANLYKYNVTDMGSAYGTIVGNMSLTDKYAFSLKSTLLNQGEQVIAGNTRFKFME